MADDTTTTDLPADVLPPSYYPYEGIPFDPYGLGATGATGAVGATGATGAVVTGATAPEGSGDLGFAYGMGDERYLTNAQRALGKKVDAAFQNSMAQKEREMARYNLPQLSSMTEDEALARAQSLALMANTQGATGPLPATARAGGGGGGGGGALRPSALTPGSSARAPGATPGTSLGSFMQGLGALLPWILGTDTMNGFMKQGLIGAIANAFRTGDASGFVDLVQSNPEVLASIPPEAFANNPAMMALMPLYAQNPQLAQWYAQGWNAPGSDVIDYNKYNEDLWTTTQPPDMSGVDQSIIDQTPLPDYTDLVPPDFGTPDFSTPDFNVPGAFTAPYTPDYSYFDPGSYWTDWTPPDLQFGGDYGW